MTAKEQVADYLRQMALAASAKERASIKNALVKYFYYLPELEKGIVEQQMEPIIEEIRQEILPTDPVLQRVEELLNRQKAVLQ